jgi:soluble lytic murein transglycosylase-like protein
LRTAVVASAAAVGAVATGTFTALVPTADDGVVAAADAAEGLVGTQLAAGRSALAAVPAGEPSLVPVVHAMGTVDGGSIVEEQLALLDKAGRLAEELAEQRAAEERERAEQERIDGVIAAGGLDGWIAKALRILELPQSLAPGVKKIVMAESGGNPRAINTWDSNAARGTPSQGLMQTIPSTYRAYVHPEMADRSITDPVANLTAGIRYMIANYGIETLRAGGRTDSSGNYIGY